MAWQVGLFHERGHGFDDAARELRLVGQFAFLGQTEMLVRSAAVDECLHRRRERLPEGPVECRSEVRIDPTLEPERADDRVVQCPPDVWREPLRPLR
jgi:hypothetical protein